MSCDISVKCVFEPIHGREPEEGFCEEHTDGVGNKCVGCPYQVEVYS